MFVHTKNMTYLDWHSLTASELKSWLHRIVKEWWEPGVGETESWPVRKGQRQEGALEGGGDPEWRASRNHIPYPFGGWKVEKDYYPEHQLYPTGWVWSSDVPEMTVEPPVLFGGRETCRCHRRYYQYHHRHLFVKSGQQDSTTQQEIAIGISEPHAERHRVQKTVATHNAPNLVFSNYQWIPEGWDSGYY